MNHDIKTMTPDELQARYKVLMDNHKRLLGQIQETTMAMNLDLSMISEEVGRVAHELDTRGLDPDRRDLNTPPKLEVVSD